MSTYMPKEPIPRDNVEELMPDSEMDHRLAHRLLKPRSLYSLWHKEEAAKLQAVLKIEFVFEKKDPDTGKIMTKSGRATAKFMLVRLEKSDPALWYYKLLSVTT